MIKNDAILKMASEIEKDPKAIEALKGFMLKGGVNEGEDGNLIPDMDFMKKAINYGMTHAKEASVNEGDNGQGGNIAAFLGMFAGGAYLADHFFHPVYEKTIHGATVFTTHLAGTPIHDPMLVAGLGGLAAAVLGAIAYNVFKKLKG